jgi:pyruvate dehydrogenase E2 component (dihydrolipoamide acetyltransferase)
MPDLFAVERGHGGSPIVLLHGFGGSHTAWGGVVEWLPPDRHCIVYDLPGHGRSRAERHGSAAVAARAVLADLAARGVNRVHLVGHSMGGATAALAALMQPEMAASVTLLAPGGFGREINHRLLRRFAAAKEEAEIAVLLEQFFGWERDVPDGLAAEVAEERARLGASDALRAIVETFFEGNSQKLLPVDELGRLGIPIKVLWGAQDRVLPTRQAHRLPGRLAVHIFEGAGHMLPQEIPDDVAALILENAR